MSIKSKLELLSERSRYRARLRQFFSQREFLEVVTPTLVSNPGLEPNIRYFETEFRPLMGRGQKQTYYLPTSPEYHLKKALSWGAEKIFEIAKAYRNGESGPEHRPEFEMLEWYRQPGSYEDIAKDVEELFVFLWKEFEVPRELKIRHVKVKDLFRNLVGVDLEEAQKSPLASMQKQLRDLGLHSSEDDSFEDLFHRLFLEKVETTFSQSEILFLWDFPAPLRALSKLASPYFCKRFEVYWGAIELGNAFDEIADADELRAVCRADQERRRKLYGKSPELDEVFIEAHRKLEANMGGIAMGVDRIFQCLRGAKTLDEVMLFDEAL